jgi:hypothetical protein
VNAPTALFVGLPTDLEEKMHQNLSAHTLQRLRDRPKTHDSQTELFRMSGELLRSGFEEWERTTILEYWFRDYYRPVTDREIERAATRVSSETIRKWPKWPEPDPKRIKAITASAIGALDELKAMSPLKPEAMSSEAIIDDLFAPDVLLCMASSLEDARTKQREFFRGSESRQQFIVPNPMSGKFGLTTDGKTSRRCLTNTGPLTYQVVEFDQGTLDEQAKIHLHLSRFVKLRLIVFSGNKSLHGWYDARSMEPEMLVRFRRYVAALGADKATFTPCQLVRTPNAKRDNGVIQTAIYLSK